MATSRPNKNTHYVVKNVRGTTGLKCGCGSWIDHWQNASRSKKKICAVLGCTQTAAVGAHVRSTDKRTSSQWWIVPFCQKHNNHKNTEEMSLDLDTIMVSANVALTCTTLNKNTHYCVKRVQVYGRTCNCTSWIEHWKRATGSDRGTCAVSGCGRTARVGAHVLSVDRRTDRQWWIAPFCPSHGRPENKEIMYLDKRITLVSANQALACNN